MLSDPAHGEAGLGVEPVQLLPPGVVHPVAGPVRLLCVEEACLGPDTVLLTAGDGMNSDSQTAYSITNTNIETIEKRF